MAWIPAVIAGVASLAGTALSNRESKRSAERQMEFQSHSVATRVGDLKSAGLNPMLGYQTPTMPGSSYRAEDYGKAVNSATVGLMHAQTRKLDAETELALSSAGQAVAQTAVLNRTVDKVAAEIASLYAETGKKTSEQVLAAVEAKIAELDFMQKKQIMPFLQQLVENDALRAKLGLPRAVNSSEAEDSFWGRFAAHLRVLFGSGEAGSGTGAAAAGALIRRK